MKPEVESLIIDLRMKGYTQKATAEMAGVSIKTVVRVEQKEIELISKARGIETTQFGYFPEDLRKDWDETTKKILERYGK